MPTAKGGWRKEGSERYLLVKEAPEAHRLYNRGRFGAPSPAGLRLHRLEAGYLVEEGRLTIQGEEPGEDPAGGAARSCYRDLRARGLVVRLAAGEAEPYWVSQEPYLRVWARENGPREPPACHYYPVPERSPVHLRELFEITGRSTRAGVKTLVAVRDSEGEMTYFELQLVEPEGGRVPSTPELTQEACMTYLGDQLKAEPLEFQASLASCHYGRQTAGKHRLSGLEGLYLALEHGVPLVGLELEGLQRALLARQHDLPLRLALYRRLRRQAYLPKTGFKFGTHFRVYGQPLGEGHAPWLTQALPADQVLTWPELARMVRLTHGVHKRLWLASVTEAAGRAALEGRPEPEEGLRLLEVGWVRP